MDSVENSRRDQEVAPGGSAACRHEGRDAHSPRARGIYAQAVSEHFETLFPGRERLAYRGPASGTAQIDVNLMRPAREQDFYVLYTTGMSDRPMTLPDELADREDLKYAELYLFLPGDWQMGEESQRGGDMPGRCFWPIHLLQYLAEFPHKHRTWLGWGHTIPNGRNYAPLGDGVGFGGVVLSWSGEDGSLGSMETGDGKSLNLYLVIPAYKEEIEYRLKYGMDALNRVFQEKELPVILDVCRPNLCPDFREVLDGAGE